MTAESIVSTVVAVVPIVITFAAALMAVLPQGAPGSKWDKIRTFVNYVAMNWGNAKNQRQP